mgnify:CR=1 FL=1
MKKMFVHTLPVMVVYLSLGIAYGILMERNGYNALWSLGTSLFVFAGAAQYALVGLLVSTISPLSVFFVILIINARHLFYGLSMLKRYEKTVRPSHLQFIEPSKRFADIIVPQGGRNLVAIQILTNHINQTLKQNAS